MPSFAVTTSKLWRSSTRPVTLRIVIESSTTMTSGTRRCSDRRGGTTGIDRSRGSAAWRRTSGAMSRITTTRPSPMIVAPKMPGTERPADRPA